MTGTQRYTQKILASFPDEVIRLAPSTGISRGMIGHLWEQVILPVKLKNNLLWSPSNSGPMLVGKQVVTIHDLVTVDHPEWFNKKFTTWYNYMLPVLCKKAAHIIAISDFTRQRLIELYRVPENKISMIYNGADLPLPVLSNFDMQLPFKRYVLSLGSLEPRKNIPLLLNAWNAVLPKLPEDVGLIVVGARGNTKIFKDAGITNIPDRVHFTGHVTDEYITQLYKNAMFFVYLSAYEGFGLPPLEAMALGTPVLVGNKTAMPEVVGDAGLLVDTNSPAECENALLRLVGDENLRTDLAAKGTEQCKKFDWNKTSLQTWDVLQRFI
ncbi:glycosyltransferase family 4 protein [Mucilaginibacter lutimaris]|uniref:Glycosyltransferase family 4 protein n=1 Tax=Mucilaginibacter lutimaris TaxID=931629 RepID=A0ABW2ZEN8_9SPHI